MELAVAAPYPVSIWYTPETYDDMEDAVQAAIAQAMDYQYEGYTVTGSGYVIEGHDERAGVGTFRGYLMFVGRAPVGSVPLNGEQEKPPKCNYALAVGAGIAGGIVVGALLGYALR